MRANRLVHQRLRQRGCVLFVVAEFTETNDIDHDVLAKLHAEVQGQTGRKDNRLRIVAVDMEYRSLDHFGDIGTVNCRTCIAWVGCGETNLVVDDQMQGASRTVTARFSEVECFHHNALTCKGSIAMHQYGQDLLVTVRTTTLLTRAHAALHDGVDDLKVRGVKGQGQVDWAAARRQVA